MERKTKRFGIRMAIDVAMALVFIAVMATALVQEAPHEYLGVALFVLVIAHIIVNRRWFAHLLRGRYNAVRIIQLLAVVGLLLCIIGQMASSLVLSEHAFWFLPSLPGAGWARTVHMLCSYWSFVFAFAHVGLQFQSVIARMRPHFKGASNAMGVWIARAVFIIVACFGIYSFIALGLPDYLIGQVQYAFADLDTPLALSFAQYGSIAVLVAGVFHYLRKLITRKVPSE